MLYNKHKLLLINDQNVREAIPGIKNDTEYYVYSYILTKKGKKTIVAYDVSPRKVKTKIVDNCLYVMSINNGYRLRIFSAYGRQLYFADTEEEAIRAYNRLVNKLNKELSE